MAGIAREHTRSIKSNPSACRVLFLFIPCITNFLTSQIQFQNLVRLQNLLGKTLLPLKTQQSQKPCSGAFVNKHNSTSPLDISVPKAFRWLVHSLVNRHSNEGVWVAHILHSGASLQIFGLNCIPGADVAKENTASESYCSLFI